MGNKNLSYTNIIYDTRYANNEINLFGNEFVKNNKNKLRMIIDYKEYEITDKYNIKSYNYTKLNIKLKAISNITNMSYMFYECRSLLSLSDI